MEPDISLKRHIRNARNVNSYADLSEHLAETGHRVDATIRKTAKKIEATTFEVILYSLNKNRLGLLSVSCFRKFNQVYI